MTPATRLKLEAALARLCLEFAGDFDPNETTIRTDAAGLKIVLTVAPPDADRRTPCEADVVAVLTDYAPRRMTLKEIRGELERRNVLWGESTLQNALCGLVARRVLINPRDKRGYGMAAPPDRAVMARPDNQQLAIA